MTETVKEKASLLILGFSILVSGIVFGFIVWLFWPWPSVSQTGEAKVINTPSYGYFKTGDLIRWTTPEVCQPSGRTDAAVYAVLENSIYGDTFRVGTPVTDREFDLGPNIPECVQNNRTSAYVSGDLPTGTYHFEIRACVKNPTPRPKCETFQGPTNVNIVRVVGNE